MLACGRVGGGTAVELFSFRDAARPCINIAGLSGGTRACGRAPSEQVPPAHMAIGGPVFVQRSPGAKLELYGETAPNVRRVVLRYRLSGRGVGLRPATLIRVTDDEALRAAGIRSPFGYFVGFVPPRATDISAEAHARRGDVLGRLDFDGVVRSLQPTAFVATRTP